MNRLPHADAPHPGPLTARDGDVIYRVRRVLGASVLLCLLTGKSLLTEEKWDSPEDELEMLTEVRDVVVALWTGEAHPVLARFAAAGAGQPPAFGKTSHNRITIIEKGPGRAILRVHHSHG